MTKCYVSRWIACYYDKLQKEYHIDSEIPAITETMEEALEVVHDFRVPKYYPETFHLYFLTQDYPIGVNPRFAYGNENKFFKYTKKGLIPIDWEKIPDDDEELSEIYLAFANPNR